jgi:hypothetical protein
MGKSHKDDARMTKKMKRVKKKAKKWQYDKLWENGKEMMGRQWRIIKWKENNQESTGRLYEDN